jgi:hemerythrin
MTALIEWREEYALGIPDVDYEHRQLITLINDLHASLVGGAGKDEVAAFLGEVHNRISAHFALEERVMRDMRYPLYQEHKADHERLLDEIVEILDDYELGGDFNQESFTAKLDSWFSGHFRTHDAGLHRFRG